MSTALAERPTQTLDPRVVQEVLLGGDLAKLTPEHRLAYLSRVCESLGLNPLTKPFAYIRMPNGKEILYATKDATDQLRFRHQISVEVKAREVIDGVYVVTAGALMPNGRRDESTGAVPIENVKGENRANAMMKAETKAKRRVTLSICGLGMLDETEVESIPQAVPIVEAPKRIDLPVGTVQVLRVEPKRAREVEWCEVTFVTHEGVEETLPTEASPTGAASALFQQLAQEACPVVLTTKVTPRSKKTVIDQVHRYQAPDPARAAENAIDAELAKDEANEAF